jgi:hypothetical protein
MDIIIDWPVAVIVIGLCVVFAAMAIAVGLVVARKVRK